MRPPTHRHIREAERRGNLPVSGVAVGLAATATTAVALLVATDALLDGTTQLATAAWRDRDLDRALDASRRLAFATLACLAATWFGAALVGLVQTRGRLTRPGPRGRGWPDRHLRTRRLVETGLGIVILGLLALLLLPSLHWMRDLIAVPVSEQQPALATWARRSLVVLALLATVLAIAHAILARRLWWRSLHLTEAEWRDEQRRTGTPAIVRHRQRATWRRLTAVVAPTPHVVLRVIDPGSRIAVDLAFDPVALPVPQVARVFEVSASSEPTGSRGHPRVEDGPLARALARAWAQSGSSPVAVPDHCFDAVADVFHATGVYRVDGTSD